MNFSAKPITVAEAYQLRQDNPFEPLTIGGYGIRRIEQMADVYHVYYDDMWYIRLQANATLTMYVADED